MHRIHVVRGYKKEAVALPGLSYVDNDRYVVDGEYRQVMLSARELSYQNLPRDVQGRDAVRARCEVRPTPPALPSFTRATPSPSRSAARA